MLVRGRERMDRNRAWSEKGSTDYRLTLRPRVGLVSSSFFEGFALPFSLFQRPLCEEAELESFEGVNEDGVPWTGCSDLLGTDMGEEEVLVVMLAGFSTTFLGSGCGCGESGTSGSEDGGEVCSSSDGTSDSLTTSASEADDSPRGSSALSSAETFSSVSSRCVPARETLPECLVDKGLSKSNVSSVWINSSDEVLVLRDEVGVRVKCVKSQEATVG